MESLSEKELVDVIFKKLFAHDSHLSMRRDTYFSFAEKKKIENEVKRYLKDNHGFDYDEDELDVENDFKRLINIIKET